MFKDKVLIIGAKHDKPIFFICIIDSIFYKKFILTSVLVLDFSQLWWLLYLLPILWSITRQGKKTVVHSLFYVWKSYLKLFGHGVAVKLWEEKDHSPTN